MHVMAAGVLGGAAAAAAERDSPIMAGTPEVVMASAADADTDTDAVADTDTDANDFAAGAPASDAAAAAAAAAVPAKGGQADGTLSVSREGASEEEEAGALSMRRSMPPGDGVDAAVLEVADGGSSGKHRSCCGVGCRCCCC